MSTRLVAFLAAVALLAGATIYMLGQSTEKSVDSPTRPAFSLPDLEGKEHAISEWDGKVLLVNFWATWCPPCRHEIPDFIEVRRKYADQGFEIVGVAIDDVDSIRDYVDVLDIDYPILWGGANASAIAREYGNRSNALPYSALIDRQGHIRFSGAGRLPRDSLEKAVQSLLDE